MPSDDELEHIVQLSLRFRHKTQAMLRNPRNYARNQRRPIYLRILWTVAAVFIAFTVLLGAAMAASPTVRAAVVDFVRSWFEDRTVYKTQDDTVAADWIFGYIPEGFELAGEMEIEMQISCYYINGKSEYLLITISTGQGIVDNEHHVFYETTINGRAADIYESTYEEYDSMIVMYDDSAGVMITLSAPLSIAELIKIAENISQS